MKITEDQEIVGRRKSSRRVSLGSANIKNLMTMYSVVEIADMYEVSRSMVYHELRSQTKVKEVVPKELADEFSYSDYYKSQGAWTRYENKIKYFKTIEQ